MKKLNISSPTSESSNRPAPHDNSVQYISPSNSFQRSTSPAPTYPTGSQYIAVQTSSPSPPSSSSPPTTPHSSPFPVGSSSSTANYLFSSDTLVKTTQAQNFGGHYIDTPAPIPSGNEKATNKHPDVPVYTEVEAAKSLTYVEYDGVTSKEEISTQASPSKYNYREIEYSELRFLDKIGAGAFGAVYKVYDRFIGKK